MDKGIKKLRSFSISYGLTKVKLPLILVLVVDNHLCFLLDTGATNNLIDHRVYEYLKGHFEELNEGAMIGIDGTKKSTPKIKLSFTFEGHDYSPIFHVFDSSKAFDVIEKESGIQIHGILGSMFFLEHGWIIDFEKKVVILDSNPL